MARWRVDFFGKVLMTLGREAEDENSRRALRARADSCRGRCGHPILQEPVLGAADGERRNCPGVRGVLCEVPEASMSLAARP